MDTEDSGKHYSRILFASKELSSQTEDNLRFLDRPILITGEPEILSTPNGKECFLDSLRLGSKICRNVSVEVPSNLKHLQDEARSLASQIAFGKEICFVLDSPIYPNYAAILNVGCNVRSDLPWTTINCQGWLARVSSVDKNLPPECDRWNPIAALAASSLGIADVFKRLIKIKASRAKLFSGLSFSLFSYTVQEVDDGPVLPCSLNIQQIALIAFGRKIFVN